MSASMAHVKGSTETLPERVNNIIIRKFQLSGVSTGYLQQKSVVEVTVKWKWQLPRAAIARF
ncbi:MAG TPA: hypothetical protein VGA21_06035 [Cyclobacteriaceae bacterium]